MDLRRASRYATKPAFWRGFGSGLSSSLRSPPNRDRFKNSFRIASYSSIVGSVLALQWADHSHALTHRPLSTADELAVALAGGLAATGLVQLYRWLWRRWNRAPSV